MFVLNVSVSYPKPENGKPRRRDYFFYDPSFTYLTKLANSLHLSCEPDRTDLTIRYTINRVNC